MWTGFGKDQQFDNPLAPARTPHPDAPVFTIFPCQDEVPARENQRQAIPFDDDELSGRRQLPEEARRIFLEEFEHRNAQALTVGPIFGSISNGS